MDPVIGAALVAAIPATIAAVAAIRTSRRVKTRNGETIGELLDDHTVVDQQNFELLLRGQQTLHEGQSALWEAVGRVKDPALPDDSDEGVKDPPEG